MGDLNVNIENFIEKYNFVANMFSVPENPTCIDLTVTNREVCLVILKVLK